MPELASVNGRIVPLAEAVVSANDRGFFFGDGVYEAVRVVGGRLWLMTEHMARFRRSLEAIDLQPYDLEAIGRQIDAVIAASGLPEATLYFHLTRGQALRDHAWPETIQPTLFISVRPYTPKTRHWAEGVTAVTHPDLRWKRCDIKSLNLLPNVLAKQAARRRGAYEAILVDDRGRVTEGSSTSALLVRGGVLVGPPEGPHILPGITRAKLFALARAAGMAVEEAFFTREELYAADEVFLAGTGDEVMPVVRVDDRPIGSGAVGPVCRRLQSLYHRAMADELGVAVRGARG